MPAQTKPTFIETRSFLLANIENILSTLTALRQDKKNDSDDLFADNSSTNTQVIEWKTNFENRSPFDILLEEKNSLGIYVSGNPLGIYRDLVMWIKNVTLQDNIHLILIEKIRKIFTKTNQMMLSLQITGLDESLDGIIFPKNAQRLSPLVEEKSLYWVFGKITRKDKDREEEGSNPDEIKEYDEMPKLMIDDLVDFSKGVQPLLDNMDMDLSVTRQEILGAVNWEKIAENPLFIAQEIGKKSSRNKKVGEDATSKLSINSNTAVTTITTLKTVTILKLSKELDHTILDELKSKLKNQTGDNLYPVEIQVQTSKGWQKAKGEFYMETEDLAKFKNLTTNA